MTSAVLEDRVVSPRDAVGGLLHISGLRKLYGDTVALADGHLSLAPGEIHALLGQHGAGKSTLIRCLAGVEHADAGEILFDGLSLAEHPASDTAMVVVHQEAGPVETRAVAENIAFNSRFQLRRGHEPPKVVVLDDPTADLGPTDVRALFAILRRLRDAGTAVLLVSQRLDEVYDLCDTATVLRDGRTVGSYRLAPLPRVQLLETITGRRAGVSAVRRGPGGRSEGTARPVA